MALDADAIEDAIEQNIRQPKRVKFGGREVEQHSIGDHLKALEAANGDEASSTAKFGLRFTQLVPPGCG